MSHHLNIEVLGTLISIANEYLSYRSDLITSGQDDSYLDYVTSYGYGELSLRQAVRDSRLPDEIKDSILCYGSEDAIRVHLGPYLTATVIGIYVDDTELIGLPVGEVEVELPEDFVAGWAKLTPDERTYVARSLEAYIDVAGNGQLAYLNHNYDRYVLLLDVEAYEADYPTDPEPEGTLSTQGRYLRRSDNLKYLEIFESTYCETENKSGETEIDLNGNENGKAWFFWFCVPGCLPDSDVFGPYLSADEAMNEAESMFDT
jgi:hypothetical protein